MAYFYEPQLPAGGAVPPAPPAPPPPPLAPVPPASRLYPLTGLALAIEILLVVQAIVALSIVAMALGAMSLPDYFGTITAITVLGYVATGVVWLVWLSRASLNVRAWNAPFQRYRWGWTIGVWFLPVVNLFAPATVTRDIADATDARALAVRRPQWLVVGWGLAFAISGLVSSFAAYQRAGLRAVDVFGGPEYARRDVDFALTWTVIAELTRLIAIVAAFALVRSLTRRQQERMASSSEGVDR